MIFHVNCWLRSQTVDCLSQRHRDMSLPVLTSDVGLAGAGTRGLVAGLAGLDRPVRVTATSVASRRTA